MNDVPSKMSQQSMFQYSGPVDAVLATIIKLVLQADACSWLAWLVKDAYKVPQPVNFYPNFLSDISNIDGEKFLWALRQLNAVFILDFSGVDDMFKDVVKANSIKCFAHPLLELADCEGEHG